MDADFESLKSKYDFADDKEHSNKPNGVVNGQEELQTMTSSSAVIDDGRRDAADDDGSSRGPVDDGIQPDTDCCCSPPAGAAVAMSMSGPVAVPDVDAKSTRSFGSRRKGSKRNKHEAPRDSTTASSAPITPIKRPPQHPSRRRRKLTEVAAAVAASVDLDGGSASRQDDQGSGSSRDGDLESARRRIDWKAASDTTGGSGVVNLSFDDDTSCLDRLFSSSPEKDSMTQMAEAICIHSTVNETNKRPVAGENDVVYRVQSADHDDVDRSSSAPISAGEFKCRSVAAPGLVSPVTEPPPAVVDETTSIRSVGSGNSLTSGSNAQSLLVRQAFRIVAAVGGTYNAPGGVSVLRMTDLSPGGSAPIGVDSQPLLVDDGEGTARNGGALAGESVPESSLRIIGEIIMPFLLAGFGCVFAGLVLGIVQHWKVFVQVSEIFILVPALLGLKGNLEMTLASRLSTQANLGHMDSTSEKLSLIGGNLALTQVQAVVVGLLAAVFAMILGWIPQRKFNITEGLLLCASSVITASLASLILGSIMIAVILLSRRFHVNPDNVATPIAASLGDLTTISLLAAISMFLFNTRETQSWVTPVVLSLVIGLLPLWWYIADRNTYTNSVLYTGWTPVIGAMVISSLGGLVLDHTVVNFEGIAVFQPVINGVGGNLVAVQASRLSTSLHKVATPGHLPDNVSAGCINPFKTFFGQSTSSRTARVLLLMVIPGQVIFMFAIKYLQSGHELYITAPFAAVYLSAAFIQVAVLLYMAGWLVNFLWSRGSDPDNASIPYLTAVGDLLGTLLLAAAFYILSASHQIDQVEPSLDDVTANSTLVQS